MTDNDEPVLHDQAVKEHPSLLSRISGPHGRSASDPTPSKELSKPPPYVPDRSCFSLVALFDAKTYFIYCCLGSVRRRFSRHRFSWPAPKSAQRKGQSASLRSHSLSSTKRWRTIGRLPRIGRSHSPCSGPFVLLGPQDPFEMDCGFCAVCKLQKLLILYPLANRTIGVRLMPVCLSLRGLPSCRISDTYRPLSYVEIEDLAWDAVE